MGASPHNLEDEAESQKKSHHPGDPGGVFCKIHRKVPEVPTFVSERSLPRTFPRICRLSSKAEQGWQVVGVVWLGLSPSVSFHHRDYDVYLNQPGTVFLTSTIWNFKIYILSPRKKPSTKIPNNKTNILGIPYRCFLKLNQPPKKNFTEKPLTSQAPRLSPSSTSHGKATPSPRPQRRRAAGRACGGRRRWRPVPARRRWRWGRFESLGVFLFLGILVVSSVQKNTGWIFCLDNC